MERDITLEGKDHNMNIDMQNTLPDPATAHWHDTRRAARATETRYGQARATVSWLVRQRNEATDIETIRTLGEQLAHAEKEVETVDLLMRQAQRAEAQAEAHVKAERGSWPDRQADETRLRQRLASAVLNLHDRQAQVDQLSLDLKQAERKLAMARHDHDALTAQVAAITERA